MNSLVLHADAERLLLSLGDAAILSAGGEVESSYERLLQGLMQAEQLHAATDPWGERLVQRYRAALEVHSLKYGLPCASGLVAALEYAERTSPGEGQHRCETGSAIDSAAPGSGAESMEIATS